jgi:hypothetical protein
MVDSPFQLLRRHERFSKGCVDFRLSRVQAAGGHNLVLVV